MQIDSTKGPMAWMVHNRVAANLLMLFFLVGGLFAFTQIRQEVFPDIQENIVSIKVAYPGASPQEVEEGIVLAVEEALTGMEGIEQLDSTASEGMATIMARLLEGSDPMKVYQDIKSEVDRITTIPEDSERPVVSLDVHRRDVISLVLYGKADEAALRELAEQARATLLQSEDITQVDLTGVRPLEIRIEIPQANLRRYGLTLQQVASRLSAASVDLPGGGIKTRSGEILLRVKERRDYARQYARLPIITGPAGAQIRLEDIATVIEGFEETDRYALYDGEPAVMLEIYRVGDQTPIGVVDAVQRQLVDIRNSLPATVRVAVLNDRAETYRQRARLLLGNGALGLILVMLLLGAFLEIRLAFWVMMGIPVSFLGSLLLMPVADLSINMMTMFAYIIALGIVVDDAIVIGENIYQQHQDGVPFMTAAVDGARQVAVPVAFSILTNIVAFIPLYMLPGVMGRVMRMLPVVVIATFLISWIECIFILPCHLAHTKERSRRGLGGWLHHRQQLFSHGFLRWTQYRYGPFLEFCLHRRYAVVTVAAAIMVVTACYIASGRMGFEMFPKVESDFAYCYAELPYGAPSAKTAEIAERILVAARDVIAECGHPELVEGIFSDVGGGGSHTVEMRVFLADPEIRNKIMSTQDFVNRWRDKIGSPAGVDLLRLQSDRGGPGSGSALTVELSHRRVGTLEEASRELAAELAKFPRVKDVDDGVQLGKEQLDFKSLPQGQRLGLTAADVARQVRNAYQGGEVLRQQRGRNEIKVKVYLPKDERVSEYDLDQMILRTPAGGEVPLLDVVDVQRGRAYTAINRRNGQRTMTVTGDVSPRPQTGQVIKVLDEVTMPGLMNRYPGLTYSYEGHQAEDRKSMDSMKRMIPMVLISIYALLAIPFRSYIQPLIVMVSIPFGVVGAVIGHLIMGYSLSMIGLIGILALSGVVVNDALVLIDFANGKRAEHDNAHDAVVAAGIQRFRAIMLTTLTTFGGLAPMIFEQSRQARFLIPMALSLGYGLLFATMITLVLVPSLYMIVEDITNLRANRGRNT
jgi:multidrug efflux pump subunit AcrB